MPNCTQKLQLLKEPMNPCAAHINAFASMSPDRIPVAYRFLKEFGTEMAPSKDVIERGKLGFCYMNSFHHMNVDLAYTEGYAMKARLIPLAHAWLTNSAGQATDCTWATGDFYFGCKFDPDFIVDMADRTGHYGVFEGLYLLKMAPEKCYEYLKTGLLR